MCAAGLCAAVCPVFAAVWLVCAAVSSVCVPLTRDLCVLRCDCFKL